MVGRGLGWEGRWKVAVVAVIIGVAALVMGSPGMEWERWGHVAMAPATVVTKVALVWLAASILMERQRGLAWGGVVLGVAILVLAMASGVWMALERGASNRLLETTAKELSIAWGYYTVLMLMMWPRLIGYRRAVQMGTVGVLVGTAVYWRVIIAFPGLKIPMAHGYIVGMLAVLLLLGVCLTGFWGIWHQVRVERELEGVGERRVKMECPRCGEELEGREGVTVCGRCALRIKVELAEGRCGKCGYLLRGLTGRVCPECGEEFNAVGVKP